MESLRALKLVLQYRFKIDTLYRIQNIVYSIGYGEIQDKIGWFAKLYTSFIIRIPFIVFLSNNNIKLNFSPRKVDWLKFKGPSKFLKNIIRHIVVALICTLRVQWAV